jgi:hypothetical protein
LSGGHTGLSMGNITWQTSKKSQEKQGVKHDERGGPSKWG